MDIHKRVGSAKGVIVAFLLGALVSGYLLATVNVQAAPVSRYVISQSAPTPVGPGGAAGGGAQCPAGYTLTGGGVHTENAFLRVSESGPLVNTANVSDTWIVNMVNEDPIGGRQGSFLIYAICVRL